MAESFPLNSKPPDSETQSHSSKTPISQYLGTWFTMTSFPALHTQQVLRSNAAEIHSVCRKYALISKTADSLKMNNKIHIGIRDKNNPLSTYLKPENFFAYGHANPVKISLVLSNSCLPLRTNRRRDTHIDVIFHCFPPGCFCNSKNKH